MHILALDVRYTVKCLSMAAFGVFRLRDIIGGYFLNTILICLCLYVASVCLMLMQLSLLIGNANNLRNCSLCLQVVPHVQFYLHRLSSRHKVLQTKHVCAIILYSLFNNMFYVKQSI